MRCERVKRSTLSAGEAISFGFIRTSVCVIYVILTYANLRLSGCSSISTASRACYDMVDCIYSMVFFFLSLCGEQILSFIVRFVYLPEITRLNFRVVFFEIIV